MDIRRIRTFLLATLVGAASALPPGVAADDTEIYTGGTVGEGTRPNVLFILDTSGSMSAFDGESKDRLDRMKDALYELLDSVDNVNIGLMRFTDPGGPILFPVAGIDEDALAIDRAGQPDVNVRVSDDDDDAEELVALGVGSPPGTIGAVILDGLHLEFSHTTAFGTDRSTIVQVDDNSHDAEQSDMFYNNTSTTLESVDNGGAGIRTVGFRFPNLPADTGPSGGASAVVTFAQLSLTAITERAGDLDLSVFGLRRQDMDPFPGGATGSGCGASHAASDIYCRLGVTGVGYTGGLNVGNLANYQPTGIPGGNVTNAVVVWDDVPDTVSNGQIASPDLSPVLQEIFSFPGWQGSGGDNDLGLFYTGTTASWRDIYSHDRSASRAAELRVDYVPAGAPFGEQLIALRFRNVRIPQGVDITNAVLEVYPTSETNVPVQIRIAAEKVADAPAFTTATGALSSRLATSTAAKQTWTLTTADAWSTEQPVQSPELAKVVQEVTDQGGWCGGNDLVLFLEYTTGAMGTRRIFAHDSDPSLAATLRVDFDESSLGAGEGCTTDDITRRVNASRDDAEQNSVSGETWLNSTIMEMVGTSTVRTNGVIFRNVPIHPGSTIESATIEFTANGSFSAGAASLTVKGEKDDAIDRFESTAYNISNRITGASGTAASVSFNAPPAAVVNNSTFDTADVSSIVAEIVGLADWDYGDEMAFVFTGSGQVDLKTFDNDPSKAALLKVRVRYNLGDVIAAGGSAVTVTVRQRLKEIIADLTHEGWTPEVDTLYEGFRYFTGDEVLYGASRGTGSSTLQRNTRLSHPGSYETPPGSVSYPSGCNTDDSNLSADACRGQTITGNPNYISPIKEGCQGNFIVLLTDGFANHNSSAGLIASDIGTACQTTFSDSTDVSSGELCGVDLARYMAENDLAPTVAGDNNVITYTIGFNISTQFLRDMAVAGDGTFYEAATSAELATVFRTIITDVLSRATSFAAPSLSVNAFNRLEDRNEVYFSLFKPSATARWNGNVKKFQLCQSEADACGDVGAILDSRVPPVEAVGADGRILDSALSFWSAAPDGPEVLEGGAGREVPTHTSRTVYTFVANGVTLTGNDSFSPPVALDAFDDSDDDGIIDSMVGGTTAERQTRTEELLGMGGATAAEINDQVDWIRGKDVDDKFEDPEYGVDRYSFSDPLHGNPLAITFGGTEADPIVKLISATNDGGIRLTNAHTGVEEFIFYPPEMMPLQNTLRADPATGKAYGVDGSATPWVRDTGDIGVIDPADGDFVRFFIGERRGGNRYYALQLDPPAGGVTDKNLTNEVTPRLMWRITGGTTEFARLGQSWSRPVLATMLVGTSTLGEAIRKRVVIFTGGYEDDQDGGFQPATAVGNAIYVVDADTGERLYVVSGTGSRAEHGLAASDPGATEVDAMVYPIPSDVAAFDSDGDNAIDRLYVGDAGGQVFRVDFAPDRSTTPGISAVVGKLAELSSDTADADKRKIFYPPTVVQVRGVGSYATGDYDLVGIVTGNRAHPLDTSVRDRFYALRDYTVGAMSATDVAPADGLSDTYDTINPDLDGDPTASPPVPATTTNEVLDFTTIDDPSDLADPSDFTGSNGYYLRLDTGGASSGEKGLAAPTTIAGKLFFTTYLPEGVVSSATCSLAEGRGQLYGIDAITGAAIINWDDDPSGELTATDRTYALGSGIPSAPVPVFFPEKVMLLIGVGGGAESVDPDVTVPRQRTYWFQEPGA